MNAFGNAHGLNCGSNEANRAGHIWDLRDAEGRMGATACIAIPWFADRYAQGRDWLDLAWWLHDHLDFHAVTFFPRLAAFNLTWREAPERLISSWIGPKRRILGRGDGTGPEADRRARYADFPPFRGIPYPAMPD